jgi:hypothetical protein
MSLRLAHADMSARCRINFPVYETVSFIFGIKAMPSSRNTCIEIGLFYLNRFADSYTTITLLYFIAKFCLRKERKWPT